MHLGVPVLSKQVRIRKGLLCHGVEVDENCCQQIGGNVHFRPNRDLFRIKSTCGGNPGVVHEEVFGCCNACYSNTTMPGDTQVRTDHGNNSNVDVH